jgi:hypothetical protein
MKKTIRLTESDLTRLVKRILSEVAEEPVIGDNRPKLFGTFSFEEGKTVPKTYRNAPVTKSLMNYLVDQMVSYLNSTGAIKTLQKFRNSPDFRIPQFIEIHLGTSQTGSGEINASVADGRKKFLESIILSALKKSGGVDAAVAKSIVINKPENTYAPTMLDKSFYDPKLSKPNPNERLAWIIIKPLATKGNKTKGVQDIQKGLNQSSSVINTLFIDGVDETKIIQYLSKLKTFSDVEDLNDAIIAGGKFDSLEAFLNEQLFNDPEEMRAATVILQRCAMNSGKQKNTVRLVGTKISIGFGE